MEIAQALKEANLEFLMNVQAMDGANKVLQYKNCIGDVHQNEDGTYWGRILAPKNICCIYEGNTLEELEEDFREMVDF